MAKETAALDAKAYNAVIARTTLRGIWMTESRFDMKPGALDTDEAALRHEISSEVEEAIIDAEGVLYGFIRFFASSRHKRQRMIHVTAKYFVTYHVDGGCDQAEADLFIRRVGRLAAYPYFRALVATLGGQAGVQLPPLPIVSFQPRSVHYARDATTLLEE
jgi:hypothetical protein